jgi:hypothetical protein
MKKILALVGLGAVAYILYKYSKKEAPAPAPEPPRVRTSAEIKKAELKKNIPTALKEYLESPEAKEAEKRFKQKITANNILLFTGEKQYVTLENLIPNRYGQYNNFYGKNYNRLNAEDTTNILAAERTQTLYKRPKPQFNNTL